MQVIHIDDAYGLQTHLSTVLKVKNEKVCIDLHGKPISERRMSPTIWDHSVTSHPTQVNAPCLNPSQ